MGGQKALSPSRREGFQELDLLTSRECAEARDEVHRLRALWVRPKRGLRIYTLGAAAYLEVPERGMTPYRRHARRLNPLLRGSLPWLYARLARGLARLLRAPVGYDESLGLPGFHIYQANPSSAPSVHLDDQQFRMRWDESRGYDLMHPLSFTVALGLPRRGAGLLYWDVPFEEALLLRARDLGRLAAGRRASYRPYRRGRLVTHSGMFLHAIAPLRGLRPGEERLTLQGHGLRGRGGWTLYW